MIKTLTLDETRKIYKKYMIKDFPFGERRSLESIEKMWKDGSYYGYSYYVGDEFYGYALFCTVPDGKYTILEYLAMTEASRGTGKGSAFLKELFSIDMGKKAILLETEDVDFAVTEAEIMERTRRDHFYEKAGVVLTSLRSDIFDVKYRIWYIPMSNMVTVKECGEEYVKIYRYIFNILGSRYKFVLYDSADENFEPIKL